MRAHCGRAGLCLSLGRAVSETFALLLGKSPDAPHPSCIAGSSFLSEAGSLLLFKRREQNCLQELLMEIWLSGAALVAW